MIYNIVCKDKKFTPKDEKEYWNIIFALEYTGIKYQLEEIQ